MYTEMQAFRLQVSQSIIATAALVDKVVSIGVIPLEKAFSLYRVSVYTVPLNISQNIRLTQRLE